MDRSYAHHGPDEPGGVLPRKGRVVPEHQGVLGGEVEPVVSMDGDAGTGPSLHGWLPLLDVAGRSKEACSVVAVATHDLEVGVRGGCGQCEAESGQCDFHGIQLHFCLGFHRVQSFSNENFVHVPMTRTRNSFFLCMSCFHEHTACKFGVFQPELW